VSGGTAATAGAVRRHSARTQQRARGPSADRCGPSASASSSSGAGRGIGEIDFSLAVARSPWSVAILNLGAGGERCCRRPCAGARLACPAAGPQPAGCSSSGVFGNPRGAAAVRGLLFCFPGLGGFTAVAGALFQTGLRLAARASRPPPFLVVAWFATLSPGRPDRAVGASAFRRKGRLTPVGLAWLISGCLLCRSPPPANAQPLVFIRRGNPGRPGTGPGSPPCLRSLVSRPPHGSGQWAALGSLPGFCSSLGSFHRAALAGCAYELLGQRKVRSGWDGLAVWAVALLGGKQLPAEPRKF